MRFSSVTISKLFTQGVNDTLRTLAEYAKNYEGKDPISELTEFIDEVKSQKDNISEDNYLQLINASDNIKFNLQKL